MSKKNQNCKLQKDQINENIKISFLRYMTVMRRLAWKHAESHNITPLQGEILCALQTRTVMRLKEIAYETGLTAATTSDAVSTLCNKGLCEKSRDRDDARALAVKLTPKGSELALKTNQNCWIAIIESMKCLQLIERVNIYYSMLKMLNEFEENNLIGKHRSCINCSHFKSSKSTQMIQNVKTDTLRYGSHDNLAQNFCSKYHEEFTDVQIRLDCSDFYPADILKINYEKKMFLKRAKVHL